MKQCHFSQLLCNILCSTDSVTDHDNPAVKSIVILRIPKYNVLTYRKNVNQCNKTISLDIFQVEKPKNLPLNPIMKSYSTHFKCHVILQMNV